MKITKNSRISKIIKSQALAIDSILGINRHFGKLKASTLQKYSDSSVIVKDLAKIGKLSSNDFLKHISNMGFDVEYDHQDTEEDYQEDIHYDTLDVVTLDVRPTIASGADPFQEIMQAIDSLPEYKTLKIINIFVPIPLINLLKGKGYITWTNTISNDEFHTFFSKVPSSNSKIISQNAATGSFEEKLESFGKKVKEIDVRHLDMPQPMVTILEEMEALPDDHVLYVHHKKIPQFLLPELKARNYHWMSKDMEAGYILFIVYK